MVFITHLKTCFYKTIFLMLETDSILLLALFIVVHLIGCLVTAALRISIGSRYEQTIQWLFFGSILSVGCFALVSRMTHSGYEIASLVVFTGMLLLTLVDLSGTKEEPLRYGSYRTEAYK